MIDEYSKVMVKESSKEGCLECGKSREESGGGWFAFDHETEGRTTAPGWRCDPCIEEWCNSGTELRPGPIAH